jgi:hypothetical protein
VEEAKHHQQNFRKSLSKLSTRWFSPKATYNASQVPAKIPSSSPKPSIPLTLITPMDGDDLKSTMEALMPLHANSDFPCEFDPG